jgi:hypothetical protein
MKNSIQAVKYKTVPFIWQYVYFLILLQNNYILIRTAFLLLSFSVREEKCSVVLEMLWAVKCGWSKHVDTVLVH